MRDRRLRWRTLAAVAATSTILLAAGCSGDGADEPDQVSIEPLAGVSSPETSTPPVGSITASPSGIHFTTFDTATRSVLALDDSFSNLLVFDTSDGNAEPRAISLPGKAATIVAPGDGTVVLPMNGSLARVDIGDSKVTSTKVEANLLSAAVLEDGRTAAGDDRGAVHILEQDGTESKVIDGLSSVDALASTMYGLTALDRDQTSVTVVDIDDGSLGIALRAGEGAAELDTDRFGRILVTDATGKELLVFSSDDLLLRQRFPVDAQPWAVTYDDETDVVWISVPALNEVVGYTLDTGIPVEVSRFPTVRQPDSLAIDSATGDLLVGSAAGEGLQRIPVGEPR